MYITISMLVQRTARARFLSIEGTRDNFPKLRLCKSLRYIIVLNSRTNNNC